MSKEEQLSNFVAAILASIAGEKGDAMQEAIRDFDADRLDDDRMVLEAMTRGALRKNPDLRSAAPEVLKELAGSIIQVQGRNQIADIPDAGAQDIILMTAANFLYRDVEASQSGGRQSARISGNGGSVIQVSGDGNKVN